MSESADHSKRDRTIATLRESAKQILVGLIVTVVGAYLVVHFVAKSTSSAAKEARGAPAGSIAPPPIFVQPKIGLEIRPRAVRNGQWVTWKGEIEGTSFPPRGITLDTEVKENRWIPFDQLIVRQAGSFSYRYRFRRTFAPTTYVFRLALPATGSGDYSFSTSNEASVHVGP